MKLFYNLIDILFYPIIFVLLMWSVFLVEIMFGLDFTTYGVYPRKIKGLIGVICSPFIHSDLKHITNNTLTFFVLSLLLRFFYKKNFTKIFLLGLLLSGLITWLIGRQAYHVGMSGVIYMLAGFVITKGVFSRNFQSLALTFLVVFLYGGMIWYIFPVMKGVSWEGHLAGLITGIILSFFFNIERKTETIKRPPLTANQELFLDHFNDKGRFIANFPFLDEDGNLIIDEEE